jgi:hypothetical protein
MKLEEGHLYNTIGSSETMEIPAYYRGKFIDENFNSPSYRKVFYIFESKDSSFFMRWLGCEARARVLQSGLVEPYFMIMNSSNEVENLTFTRRKAGLPQWKKSTGP